MISVRIALLLAAAVMTDNVALSDAGPFQVNAYLCETTDYAIAFAAAKSQDNESDFAKDLVGRIAKREVCGRYVGVAFLKDQKIVLNEGYLYRVTALQFKEDNRIGWAAERTFAVRGRSDRQI